MRKSKESMDVFSEKEKKKSPLEIMEEMKKREEEIAKEDKTGTPWNLIDPDLITHENLELFSHFNDGEMEIAQEEVKVAKIKLEKIKDEKARSSNEALLRLIDDKISAEIAKRELKEEQEKDNY
jgi:hypothetical protein